MQTVNADQYRGRRMRLAAFMKCANVEQAGLWMRVDGEQYGSIAFDNMAGRWLKGTRDWTRYEIVLDIPLEGASISFGVHLSSGRGQIWVDDIDFEPVDNSTPTTDLNMGPELLPKYVQESMENDDISYRDRP